GIESGLLALFGGPPMPLTEGYLADLACHDVEAAGMEVGAQWDCRGIFAIPGRFNDGAVVAGNAKGSCQTGFVPRDVDDDVAVVRGILGGDRGDPPFVDEFATVRVG